MRFRVIDAQCEPFDTTGCPSGLKLLDVRLPVPQLACGGRAVELRPGMRSGQRMLETLEMNLPGAIFEIEIVLAISLANWLFRCCDLGVCGPGKQEITSSAQRDRS
jgi:hypothetical protein